MIEAATEVDVTWASFLNGLSHACTCRVFSHTHACSSGSLRRANTIDVASTDPVRPAAASSGVGAALRYRSAEQTRSDNGAEAAAAHGGPRGQTRRRQQIKQHGKQSQSDQRLG